MIGCGPLPRSLNAWGCSIPDHTGAQQSLAKTLCRLMMFAGRGCWVKSGWVRHWADGKKALLMSSVDCLVNLAVRTELKPCLLASRLWRSSPKQLAATPLFIPRQPKTAPHHRRELAKLHCTTARLQQWHAQRGQGTSCLARVSQRALNPHSSHTTTCRTETGGFCQGFLHQTYERTTTFACHASLRC